MPNDPGYGIQAAHLHPLVVAIVGVAIGVMAGLASVGMGWL